MKELKQITFGQVCEAIDQSNKNKESIEALNTRTADLEQKQNELVQKTENVTSLNEKGFFLHDKFGNVGFKVIEGIIEALGFGDNLTAKLKQIVKENMDFSSLDSVFDSIRENIASINNGLAELDNATWAKGNVLQVDDKGLHLIDKEGNIGWSICPMITQDGGICFVDKDGNIGISIKNGEVDVAAVGENLRSLLGGGGSNVSPDAIIEDVQDNYAMLRQLKDETEQSINSLLSIKEAGGNNYNGTITIPAHTEDRKNVVVRVGLHYGATPKNCDVWNEVFFDGNVRKDFSDIRFKDGEKILNTRMRHSGNYEVLRNKNIPMSANCVANSSNELYYCDKGYLKKSTDSFNWTNAVALPYSSCMRLLGFDKADNAYIDHYNGELNGGFLYISRYIDGEYINPEIILDYRQANGTDDSDYNNLHLQTGGFVVDALGYVYIGRYQLKWNPIIYRSVNPNGDGGFKIVYKETLNFKPNGKEPIDPEVQSQHVHCINIHQTQDKDGNIVDNIFAGLDNSQRNYGAVMLQSIDHGTTWQRVTCDDEGWAYQRGRDYSFNYVNVEKGVAMITGETNILGGYTLVKGNIHVDDNGKIVLDSVEGKMLCDYSSRKTVAFSDGFAVTALAANGAMHMDYQLVWSDDELNTFHPLYAEWYPSNTFSAGKGARWFHKVMLEGEECFIGTGYYLGHHNRAYNIYHGGNHYYGEILVNVGDIPANETKTISVESGYMMQAPNKQIFDSNKIERPVWELYLKNGKVEDSDGKQYITYNTEIDNRLSTPKFGGLYPYEASYEEGRGVMPKLGSVIDLGKISKLNFNKGFSIVLWVRLNYPDCPYIRVVPDIDTFMPMLSFGNDYHIGMMGNNIYVGKKTDGSSVNKGVCSVHPIADIFIQPTILQSYVPICVSVSNDSVPTIKVFGGDATDVDSPSAITSWNLPNIADTILRIGSANTSKKTNGHMNWRMFFNKISFYDRALTRKEFMSLWHGCDVNIY